MRGICVVAAAVVMGMAVGAVEGAPAYLGLTSSTVSPVIIGAQVPVNAFVYNQAAAGANDLDYSITFKMPDGTKYQGTGVRAADGGAGYDHWQKYFDTSGSPYGVNTATISATDPNALNDPQVQQLPIEVMAHAVPGVWIAGKLVTPGAQAPSVEPLAFGATGGGSHFAAKAPNVIGDPPLTIPTAELDLDYVHPHGDPQITVTLAPFVDLPANDDPTAGDAWSIDVDASQAGTFTTYFDLGFSDEQDLLGADAPGSVAWEFEVTATVSADLSTVTGNLIVLPEPGSASMVVLGAAGVGTRFRGRRRRHRH
ncbi:MAG: hypothetical protein ACTHN5_17935 [Phycisphaerae bacterium]